MRHRSPSPLVAVAAALPLAAALSWAAARPSAQMLSYTSGQSVYPAFEGWEKNEDGSQAFVFGFMNENWVEELDVPIGPDNNIDPGGPDRGQPTHFLPRRNRFAFRVPVPKDFGQKEMVWTLTTHGKTVKAYASLKPDYLLENIDLMSETGALGAGISNPQLRADKPPVVTIEGERTRAAKVGQPLSITAVITDDGVPRTRPPAIPGAGGAPAGAPAPPAAPPSGGPAAATPERGAPPAAAPAGRGPGRNPALIPPIQPTVGKRLGLHASWFVYRGAGKVAFDPLQTKVWEDTRVGANSPWAPLWTAPPFPADGRSVVQVTFDQPGSFVLRLRADDGALSTDQDVTVNVMR